MDRPYFRKSIDELVEVFRNSHDDLRSMRDLLAELDHRNTAGAKSLKATVSNRIVGLMESSRSGVSPIQENENVGTLIRPTRSLIEAQTVRKVSNRQS